MTNTTLDTIHTATVHLDKPLEDGTDAFYFVSLDGERYLPVSRLPWLGERGAIAELFAGNGQTKPMTCAPRWIRWTAEENNGTVEWGETKG